MLPSRPEVQTFRRSSRRRRTALLKQLAAHVEAAGDFADEGRHLGLDGLGHGDRGAKALQISRLYLVMPATDGLARRAPGRYGKAVVADAVSAQTVFGWWRLGGPYCYREISSER